MMAAVGGFIEGQGPLKSAIRPLQFPKFPKHVPQVVHIHGHLGMLGAISGLVDSQGPLVVRPGPYEVPQVLEHVTQVVGICCQPWMVRFKYCFTYR